MNKEEFMKLCKDGGYADKKVAAEYCKGKDEFDDSDFIEVFRISQRRKELDCGSSSKWRRYNGAKTTKLLNHTDI